MTPGKLGAQCGHAAQIALIKYFKLLHDQMHNWTTSEQIPIFQEWLNSSFRKVTLTADDKEWEKVKEIFVEGVIRFTVVDAGLTQIPAGSETLIAIWPMYKSHRPKILQKLQALK